MSHGEKSSVSNLIRNGDFKQGLEHWEGTDLEVGTVAGLPGLRGNPTRITHARQQTGAVVIRGKSYRMSFFTVSENISPNEKITIQLGTTINGSHNSPGLYTIKYENRTWTKFDRKFVPDITGTLQANIYLTNQSADVLVYISNIRFNEIVPPARRIALCIASRVKNLIRFVAHHWRSLRR